MNFADTVGIYKYQRFGANILEIGPFLLKLLRKYGVLMSQKIALKRQKHALLVTSQKLRNKYHTQTKIGNVISEDRCILYIIIESLTLQSDFVILDLKSTCQPMKSDVT